MFDDLIYILFRVTWTNQDEESMERCGQAMCLMNRPLFVVLFLNF